MIVLGIDTGGTFTDFVLYDGQRLTIHKVLSTPNAPEKAILQGIADLGLTNKIQDELLIIHGSTVATNAVLEGKGVATVFITNRGHGDMLTIGRQARRELYVLQPEPIPPPVPREYCLETGGRLDCSGATIEALTEADLLELKQQIERLAPEAVAINLLFSYLDDRFEKQIAAIVPPGLFVSRSSEILPEINEYERGITTWLNASIGPLVSGYLQRLCEGVPRYREKPTGVAVMLSSGGTIEASQVARQAVNMLLSGPAGGVAGAKYIAAYSGRDRLLTFDMGGTSTDVALIDGDIQLTNEGHIGHYPVGVPMVDMHTIGAGGGSIAYIDNGGLLQVGPESAGADPGPACYGKGGQQATVTDANLLMGRLRPDAFLGGNMQLDCQSARTAVMSLAKQLSLDVATTAQGIIRIANEHMVRALRVMSVERGLDPRPMTLVSFGGAGGLHVCALADALGMGQALVPVNAGVLSALGMLVAPRQRHLSQSYTAGFSTLKLEALQQRFDKLAHRGIQSLVEEGVSQRDIEIQRSVDLRYRGQAYALNIAWSGIEQCTTEFHGAHEKRYGHRLNQPLELVTVRVKLQGRSLAVELPEPAKTNTAIRSFPRAVLPGIGEDVAIIDRMSIGKGQVLHGPLLITETVSTTLIEPAWRCKLDKVGNLLLQRS